MTEEQKRLIPRIVFWKREIKEIELFIDYFGGSESKVKPFFKRKTSFCYVNRFNRNSNFECSEVVAMGFLSYMQDYKKHLEKLVSECDTELIEIADMYLNNEMELSQLN